MDEELRLMQERATRGERRRRSEREEEEMHRLEEEYKVQAKLRSAREVWQLYEKLLHPQDSSSSVHVSAKPPHQDADRDDIKHHKQMFPIPVTAKPLHQDAYRDYIKHVSDKQLQKQMYPIPVIAKPAHQDAETDYIKHVSDKPPQEQMFSIPVTAKPSRQDANRDDIKHQTEITSILNKLINLQCSTSLPTPDMEIFDGHDITAFPIFLKTFKLVVENNCGDPARRLEALLKYTRGEANDLLFVLRLVSHRPKEQ